MSLNKKGERCMLPNNQDLVEISNIIRKDIVDIAYKAGGPSHPGPALSCTDIVTALYF
ncbi:MAG: transketolase, partial [Clostridiales bacterium]|nr:transketolase [Clostridiales bacterium]